MLCVPTPIGMRAATKKRCGRVAAHLMPPGIRRPRLWELALPLPAAISVVSVPALLPLPPPLFPAIAAGRAPVPVVHPGIRARPLPRGRQPLLAPGLLWCSLGRVCVGALREQLIIIPGTLLVTSRFRRRKELVIAQVGPVCVLWARRQISGGEPACSWHRHACQQCTCPDATTDAPATQPSNCAPHLRPSQREEPPLPAAS